MSLDPQAPVSSLGEDGLVELLRQRFRAPEGAIGIGDDAAVIKAGGLRTVVTTDTLVEDVDFSFRYASGADLGWKAMAANLSDIAAMAGVPRFAVATLCLPPSTPQGLVMGIVDGLQECAERFDTALVGGDISSAPVVSLGITVFGDVQEPVLRSGAAVGDAICVTGTLGGSARGLARLRQDPEARGPVVTRHLRPVPRVQEGRFIGGAGATSMMDVSDGLVRDLYRLLSASGKGCAVRSESLPVDRAPAEGNEPDRLRAAMFGGEDFELLFTIPGPSVSGVRDRLGTLDVGVTEIGTVTEGRPSIDGLPLEELLEETWDHLRSP